MKTGFQYGTRKDRLESIATKSQGMNDRQKIVAWDRLMGAFDEICAPESPRTPRFNDLLLAVVSAQARAKSIGLSREKRGAVIAAGYDSLTFFDSKTQLTHINGVKD